MSEAPSGIGKVVRYEKRDDHVAIITLDRPEARNAINGEVAHAMDYLVDLTEGDADVDAVILASSHDRVFCAGADLAEISRGNAQLLSTERGGFAGLVKAKRAKPWIAAVRGAAFAGGCELALSCDMIVASDDSRFGLPEVKRGLFAGAGGPFRLVRGLPRNVALELVSTGDALEGARAFAFGLVNRLVPADRVLDAAIELAGAITVNAPFAVQQSLAITRIASEMTEEEYWEAAAAYRDRVFAHEDAQEGPRAFLEKRAPRWSRR